MRALTAYLLLVGAPLVLLLLILDAGGALVPGLPAPPQGAAHAPGTHGFILLLLVQVGVILIAARITGALFRRLRQPQVVGEMVAGILLGPSLLGWIAPGISAALFPVASLGYLSALSQVGLVLFMFLVGLEFEPRLLRGRGHVALVTSHVSIIAPFVLGAALALLLYPRLAEGHVTFTGFALFMGAAMSITAFPVLARILTERNLLHTRVGAIAIACAAIDDVTAWSLLAVVIAIVRSDASTVPLATTLGGSALFVIVMVFGVRRALGALESFHRSRGRFTQDMLAITLLLLLASSLTTEWLGVHALFGAFALGAVMPKEPGFVHDLSARLEDFTVVFLLPLFFAFTGLRTSIGLVSGVEMWAVTLLVLLVAVGGKFGGSTIAARVTGLTWRESAAVGVLMNTRGLMELVILTIGLDLGVITPTLFTIMVLMALVTTFMTTPLLELIYPARLLREEEEAPADASTAFATLIPVSLPSAGPRLLAMAHALTPAGREQRAHVLHLHIAAEQSLAHMQPLTRPSDEQVLRPALEKAAALGVDAVPLAFVSHDAGRDIADVANIRRVELVVMGSHRPVFTRSIIAGSVSTVLHSAACDVAIFIDRGSEWRRVLVPFRGGASDELALQYAARIGAATGAHVHALHAPAPGSDGTAPEMIEGLSGMETMPAQNPLGVLMAEARNGYDLVVLGLSPAWGLQPSLFASSAEQVADVPGLSLLLVRERSTRVTAQKS